jgi:hypothetical protein
MVTAYSELLQQRFRGPLGETGEEYIRHTVRCAIRIGGSLARFLDFYASLDERIRSQEDLDAGDVLKKALTNLEVTIRESGAMISRAALPRVRMYEFQLEHSKDLLLELRRDAHSVVLDQKQPLFALPLSSDSYGGRVAAPITDCVSDQIGYAAIERRHDVELGPSGICRCDACTPGLLGRFRSIITRSGHSIDWASIA